MAAESLFLRGVLLEPDEALRESYVYALPAVRCLLDKTTLSFHRPVTCFVGENGAGKSTLLEALAACWGLNPEGGSQNFCFSTNDTHSPLHHCLRAIRGARPCRDSYFLRAESFYNAASYIEELDRQPAAAPPVSEAYGGRSLHAQSHGESFLTLALQRFHGEGLYLLDEPEAALSPARQLTLLTAMHTLVEKGSQFVLATHSPILLAYPEAEILLFDDAGIRSVDYRQTEHYQITRQFLEEPDRVLRMLWEEDASWNES